MKVKASGAALAKWILDEEATLEEYARGLRRLYGSNASWALEWLLNQRVGIPPESKGKEVKS